MAEVEVAKGAAAAQSPVAAEMEQSGLSQEVLERFSGSTVSPDQLALEAGALAAWQSKTAGYVALGPSYERVLHHQVHPEQLVLRGNRPIEQAMSGRVFTEKAGVEPLSGGGFKSEETHVLLDENWARGAVYRQAAAMRARNEGRVSPLENNRTCLLVFKLDSTAPNPFGHIDHIDGEGEWRLETIIADNGVCQSDGYSQLLQVPEAAERLDPRFVPEAREEWLHLPGMEFAHEFRSGFAKVEKFRKVIDALAETFRAMHRAKDFRFEVAADYINNGKNRVSRSVKADVLKLLGIYQFHSVTPVDWSVPCRASNAMSYWQNYEKDHPGLSKEAEADIERFRDNARLAVLQSLGYGASISRAEGYSDMLQELLRYVVPMPVRFTIRGMDIFDLTFIHDLGREETRHDPRYAKVAAAKSIRYSKLEANARMVIEPTRGNLLTKLPTMDETAEERSQVPAIVYTDGDTMMFDAENGYYPAELIRSFYDPRISNMFPGVAAHFEAHSVNDDMQREKFLVIDASLAPGVLMKYVNEVLDHFNHPNEPLDHNPLLIEMLTYQPLVRWFSSARIARIPSRPPQLAIDVQASIAEGEGLIYVRTADQKTVRLIQTEVTRSDIVAKQIAKATGLEIDKSTLKGLEDQYQPMGEPPKVGEVALAGVEIFGHTVRSKKLGNQAGSETIVARNPGRPVTNKTSPASLRRELGR